MWWARVISAASSADPGLVWVLLAVLLVLAAGVLFGPSPEPARRLVDIINAMKGMSRRR